MAQNRTIAPAEGRLGVLTVGLGAVATTLIAGTELARRGMIVHGVDISQRFVDLAVEGLPPDVYYRAVGSSKWIRLAKELGGRFRDQYREAERLAKEA